MSSTALVLGGGGVTGIAWELGIIAGLLDTGLDLRNADLVVGTSAGSTVGAQILINPEIEELYAAQIAGPGKEIRPKAGSSLGFMARIVVMTLRARRERDEETLRDYALRAGAFAKKARTVAPEERFAVIESRLPSLEWPTGRLQITAVNADSGERRVFDRDSGVSLLEAVAASCAVPGIWPPVRIDGGLYIDGGISSPANVDLVAGYEHVVVLAPIGRSGLPGTGVAEQVEALGAGVRAHLVQPDKAALDAIGRNPLDPRSRVGAGKAGREQAPRIADAVAEMWTS